MARNTRKIPYEILFLFGAGFGIASAVQNTGLDNTIAQYLLVFSDWPINHKSAHDLANIMYRWYGYLFNRNHK